MKAIKSFWGNNVSIDFFVFIGLDFGVTFDKHDGIMIYIDFLCFQIDIWIMGK